MIERPRITLLGAELPPRTAADLALEPRRRANLFERTALRKELAVLQRKRAARRFIGTPMPADAAARMLEIDARMDVLRAEFGVLLEESYK